MLRIRAATLRDHRTPTIIRRALTPPTDDRWLSMLALGRWESLLISFVARTASGELTWR